MGRNEASDGWTVGRNSRCAIADTLSKLKTLLYGVDPRDTSTFAIIAAVLLVVALAANLIPALGATQVDPVIALRHD